MDDGAFSEPIVKFYSRQLLLGLLHIYTKGFSHRDLKPENILLDEDYNIKLVDFGFACKLEARDGTGFSHSVVGTPGYMAPEVLQKKPYQGHYADLFSFAVIIFALKTGHPPFDMANPTDNYYSLIYRNRIEEFWQKHKKHHPAGFFSDSFIDLMSMLFQAEPNRRPVIADIIGHQWFQEGDTATAAEAQDEMMRRRQMRLTKEQLARHVPNAQRQKKVSRKVKLPLSDDSAAASDSQHESDNSQEYAELVLEKLEGNHRHRLVIPD